MKLIAAQIASIPGNIQDNLAKHVRVIHQAAGLDGGGIEVRRSSPLQRKVMVEDPTP
jgi:hypothetical protein